MSDRKRKKVRSQKGVDYRPGGAVPAFRAGSFVGFCHVDFSPDLSSTENLDRTRVFF